MKISSFGDWNRFGPTLGLAFQKLDPRVMVKNPVMFVTVLGAVQTTATLFTATADFAFIAQLAGWLWLTVLFANLA